MAIAPNESLVTFILAGASSILYVDEVGYSFVNEPFDRVEFSNDKLRAATTAAGATPLIQTNWTGQRIQLGIVCTGDSPRPLNSDDSNASNIKQRFNIERFTLNGAVSLASEVDEVRIIAEAHQKLLSKFQYHIAKGGMDISYLGLVAMQAETFSYLTSTGLTVTGPAIGTGTNMLLSSFSTDVAYEVSLPTSGSLVLQKWSAVVESRSITSLGA